MRVELPPGWTEADFRSFLKTLDKKPSTPRGARPENHCGNCGHFDPEVFTRCAVASGTCLNAVADHKPPTWWKPRD